MSRQRFDAERVVVATITCRVAGLTRSWRRWSKPVSSWPDVSTRTASVEQHADGVSLLGSVDPVPGGEMTFADLIAQLNYPMIVVTTASAGERAGCLVGFHTQCSIEPERFAIWLSKANYSFRVALFAETFAVHALDVSNVELATHFGAQTGDEIDKFEHCRWTEGPDGVPLLDDCPNRLISRRVGLFDDGGDHVCMVLEPLKAEGAGPFEPLPFQQVRHLQAGHDVDDRPVPRQHL